MGLEGLILENHPGDKVRKKCWNMFVILNVSLILISFLFLSYCVFNLSNLISYYFSIDFDRSYSSHVQIKDWLYLYISHAEIKNIL